MKINSWEWCMHTRICKDSYSKHVYTYVYVYTYTANVSIPLHTQWYEYFPLTIHILTTQGIAHTHHTHEHTYIPTNKYALICTNVCTAHT